MLVYSVQWISDPELVKGKGRLKNDEFMLLFSVLCRNISDAQRCFNFVFDNDFPCKRLGLTPDDGVLTFKRNKIDSRNFDAKYLMLKEMSIPLNLHDVNSSLYRLAGKYVAKI